MAFRKRGVEGEQYRKLFIGGITSNTTEQDLRDYYGAFGEIVDAVVMVYRGTNRSRGFGFVTFSEPAMVDTAQASRPHIIHDREVEAKRATPREESGGPEAHQSVNKLFVANVRKEVTEDKLRNHFGQYGNIEKVEIIKNNMGESRGFAFITFDDYDPVDKAILYRPHNVCGQKLDCRKALPKDNHKKSEPPRYNAPSSRYGSHPPPQSYAYGSDPYGPPPMPYDREYRDYYYDPYSRYPPYGYPPRAGPEQWGYEDYGEGAGAYYGESWSTGYSQAPTHSGPGKHDPREGYSAGPGPIRNGPKQVKEESPYDRPPISGNPYAKPDPYSGR